LEKSFTITLPQAARELYSYQCWPPITLTIMFFHSEIDRNRQTEKDRHKHKHKKLYFLQHSTIEILHTCDSCMYNTKTNQVMKITKSTNTTV